VAVPTGEPNGGWWWDLGPSVEKPAIYHPSQLPEGDQAVEARYAEYEAGNFNDQFIPGQGVETVFEVLRSLSPRRRWLDIATGTSPWFWAQSIEGHREIVLSDIRVEPLRLTERVAASGAFPRAYGEAREACGLPPTGLEDALAARRIYALFDAREQWPEALTNHDLITMIGFCGLRSPDEIYTTELQGARAALAPGGIVVGVDWTRTEAFARRDGHGNSYVGRDLLEQRAGQYGLRITFFAEAEIAGDPLYSSLCVWCVADA
jgi:hypothetical protein